MRHSIDLHGLSYKEALAKTETVLIAASFDKVMVCEIITGKSKTMQDRIIEEILNQYSFDYYIPPNNTGMIIVTQNEL
jgi:DNA-nicking Smr family endonuclease